MGKIVGGIALGLVIVAGSYFGLKKLKEYRENKKVEPGKATA